MTLGELLTSKKEIIKRNALSVLKSLQREDEAEEQYKIASKLCAHGMPYSGQICAVCHPELAFEEGED